MQNKRKILLRYALIIGLMGIVAAMAGLNVFTKSALVDQVLSQRHEQVLESFAIQDGGLPNNAVIASLDGTVHQATLQNVGNGENLLSHLEQVLLSTPMTHERVRAQIASKQSAQFHYVQDIDTFYVRIVPVQDVLVLSAVTHSELGKSMRFLDGMAVAVLGILLVPLGIVFGLYAYYAEKRYTIQLEKEERVQSLLYNMQGGLISLICPLGGEQPQLTYASEGFTMLTGYTMEDIHQLFAGQYLRIIAPEDRKRIISGDLYGFKMEYPNRYTLEYRIVCKDGSVRWLSEHGVSVAQKAGIMVYESVLTDVTYAMKREQELRLSNQKNEGLIANMQGGLIVLEIRKSTGTVRTTYVSEGWTQLTGYTLEQIEEELEGNPRKIILPDDLEMVDVSYTRQMKEGNRYQIEYHYRRRDGVICSLKDCGILLEGGQDILILQSIMTDMTETMARQRELTEKNRLLSQIMENLTCGIVMSLQEEGKWKPYYVSDSCMKISGYSVQELEGAGYETLILPEDLEMVHATRAMRAQEQRRSDVEYRIRCKDGSIKTVMECVTFAGTEQERVAQVIYLDVTPRARQEEELRLTQERMQVANAMSMNSLLEYDMEKQCYVAFYDLEKNFGSLAQEKSERFVPGISLNLEQAVRALYHPQDVTRVLRTYCVELARRGRASCQARVLRSDGSSGWCEVNLKQLRDRNGEPVRLLVILTNIDRQKYLEHQAQTDALTGLYNKMTATRLIGTILQSGVVAQHALFVIDIDDFKQVNDTMGHSIGDVVLMETASELQKMFREGDIVARVGGDEFAVLMTDIPGIEAARAKAEALCDVFHSMFVGGQQNYKISCSIGIVLSSAGQTYDMLFENADTAMYNAKYSGKDQYAFYKNEMNFPLDAHVRYRDEVLERTQEGMLSLSERVFDILYSSTDLDASVMLVLSFLGKIFGASRTFVFENDADDTSLSNTFEWCATGIVPQKAELQKIGVDDVLPYYSLFDQSGVFACRNVAALEPPFADALSAQGIKSTMQIMLTENGVPRGLVGMDDCINHNLPNGIATQSLVQVAKVLGTFILKKRREEETVALLRNRVDALEELPISAYVIDQDHAILYMNKAACSIFPGERMGQKCYKSFVGRDRICENCPAMRCGAGTAQMEITNALGMHILTTATAINWQGVNKASVLVCQDITGF